MSDNKIAVSVIIPVYNAEKYLEKCIDSVLGQTLKENIEILLVNDGSTDQSQEIINKYQEKFPQIIKGYYQTNMGVSQARNYALDLAQGEYVTFLDSDDYMDENYLETLYYEAKKYNSDMVCSGQRKVSESGEIRAVLTYPIDKNPKTVLRRLNMSGKIYKRSCIERHSVRFAEGKTYEDNVFNLVMIFMAENFKILQYEGYNQIVHDGSITSKKILDEKIPYEALEKAISYIVEKKAECNDYLAFEYTVLSFFTYFIFQANKKHLYLNKGKERKSDCEVVLKFCDFTKSILNRYMTDYYKNPNVKIFKNKELQLSQRCGVWLYSKLCRWNLLNAFVKLYYRI